MERFHAVPAASTLLAGVSAVVLASAAAVGRTLLVCRSVLFGAPLSGRGRCDCSGMPPAFAQPHIQ